MTQWLAMLIGPAVLVLMLVAVYRARQRQDSWTARLALIGLALLLVFTLVEYAMMLLPGSP